MKNLVLPILRRVGRWMERRRRLAVVVPQFAVRQPLHLHPRRMKRDQLADGTLATALDVCVSVAPEQKPRLHQLAELEARHPGIWLVADDLVEVLLFGDFLASAG